MAARKKLPVLREPKPELTKLGVPKAERPTDLQPILDEKPSSPLNVAPRMRGTRQKVQPNFMGGPFNLTPEVDDGSE